MRVFVSYARNDREAVDALLQDIRRARHEVWLDEELTGGQAWWETILGTIRAAGFGLLLSVGLSFVMHNLEASKVVREVGFPVEEKIVEVRRHGKGV